MFFGIFTPKIGEDFQVDIYLLDGLKPPEMNLLLLQGQVVKNIRVD